MTRQNMIDQELAPKDTFIDDERTSGEDDLSSPKKNVVPDDEDDDDDWVQIQDDVYSMFFLSNWGGQAFWYGFYVFGLKIALYTFLALDAVALEEEGVTSPTVLAAQFLMLPVAVAMQDDLIHTFFVVANLDYSDHVLEKSPHASRWKFHAANTLRGVDGIYSLLVNFAILVKAPNALALFLNFAALQFLQNIDNIAVSLASDGFLFDRLEEVAAIVLETKMPKKKHSFYNALDSIFFLSTFAALLIAWGVIKFS